MSERNEHCETIERAKALSRIVPDAASTQRALDAARAVIESAQLQHRRSRRRIWIMSSIAASILILIGFVTTVLPNRASAADELKQVAEANKRYQGWVHISNQTHFNTVDGTWATVSGKDGELQVHMYVPSQNEEIVYDSRANEIRIGQTWKDFSKNWAKMIMDYPLTVTNTLAMAKEKGIAEPQINKSVEGGLDRFDISSTQDPKHATFWVDPTTKLIQKAQSEIEGQTEIINFTYGDPVIHDVYDLGVPRTAKVIDTRPPAKVEQLYDRLRQHTKNAFGDTYVALISESITDAEHKDEPQAITVIAKDHDMFLNHRYLLGPEDKIWTGFHQAVPTGWPTPTLADMREAMKHHPPVQGMVSDGKTGWGFLANDQTRKIESQKLEVSASSAMRLYGLPERIWPSQEKLGAFGADSKSEIVTDKDHPGLIGLRVTQKIWTGRGDPDSPKERSLDESMYWLDPAHSEVSVERFNSSSQPGSEKMQLDYHSTYSDLKQLPSGEWYPTRQQCEVTLNNQNPPVHYTQVDVMQVLPGEHIDASLFTDPAKYPTTQK
jgi:hypothetical protein